jgi:serine/threonine protein kinase/Flp pilus assembly protein TadD
MSNELSEVDPLDDVAEAFVARYRRGERPSLTEYTDRYPELADRIRELIPALVVVEEVGSLGAGQAKAPAARPARESRVPDQLGDYRILREVGRGGMGIVYEALQESLGRYVALKVLPFHVTLTPMHLERFRREVQAAAQLHHTNIVPVFGVGEKDGLHYYAMQFIQGQGLDCVLQELRQLRRGPGPAPAGPLGKAPSALARSVAHGLLTGQFAGRNDLAAPVEPTTAPPTEPVGPAVLSEAAESSGSTYVVAGDDSELTTQTDAQYFHSVARVGVQVAEALSHAHQQGILHRDIKPSNLLLDTHGTVWVTDFGLAKAAGSEDLTEPGDIVGTLRYMAPERFQGVSDVRSDVYSLGATLYELVTLHPPFADTDRLGLIRRVTEEAPVPPRRRDARIPRDLETILLKALEKDPARRFQTAAELAGELRLFLADRPLHIRRSTWREHLWRWCRRNPSLAGLLTVVALLAITSASLFVWHLQEKRRMAEDRAAEVQDALDRLTEANNLIQRARFYLTLTYLKPDWARAHADLTRAVELRPDHSFVWFERASFYNRLGLWDLAAQDYAAAFQIQQPLEPRAWCFQACLSLYSGDRDRYGQLVLLIPARFDPEENYCKWEQGLVRACTLAPVPAADLEWAKRMADRAVERYPYDTFNYYAQGLVCLRSGEFQKAIEQIQEASRRAPQYCWGCPYACVRAMAHHRLGQHGAAREALTQADQAMDRWSGHAFRLSPDRWPWGWWEWLEGHLLYREAKTLIDGAPPLEDGRLLLARGWALAALGQKEKASACYARALKLRPEDLHVRLAAHLARIGEPIEAEQLKVLSSNNCLACPQDMEPYGGALWSDGQQLFCRAANGGHVEVELRPPRAGSYQLDIYFTRAPDFGMVEVRLDGQKIGGALDGYAVQVEPSGRVEFGRVELGNGPHRLRFTAMGKQPRSTGYNMGIDVLELRPSR